jgi:hypothetical protein
MGLPSSSSGSTPPSPFNPGNFYSQAKRMAVNATSETSLRTAVGRAYYSVYLRVRDHAKVVPLRHSNPKKRGETEHVWTEQLLRLVSTDGDDAADKLVQLKRLRHTADYDLLPSVGKRNWATNWATAKALADYIIAKLDTI